MTAQYTFVLLALIAAGIGGVPIKDGDEALITDGTPATTLGRENVPGQPPQEAEQNSTDVQYREVHHGQHMIKSKNVMFDSLRLLAANRGISIPDYVRNEYKLKHKNYTTPPKGTMIAVEYNQNDPSNIITQLVDKHGRPIRDVTNNPFPYQNAIGSNRQIQNGPQFRSFYGAQPYSQPYQIYRPSYQSYGVGPYGYRPVVQNYAPEGYQPITQSENKVYSKQSKGGYSFYQPPAPKMKFNRWTGPTYSVNKEDTKSSIDYNMLGKLFGKGSAGIKGMFSDWGVNKYGNQDKFTATGGSKSQVNRDRFSAASGPGVQGYSGGARGGFSGQSNANVGPGGYGRGSVGSSAYGQAYGGVNRPYGGTYGTPSFKSAGPPTILGPIPGYLK